MKLLIAALFALVATPAHAHARATSEYTSLDDCKTIASSENDPNAEIDFFSSICKGRDGYRVSYDGGDSRSWIGLLAKGDRISESGNSWLSLDEKQGFFPNIAGLKLEWRYHDDVLRALIVRTSGNDPETDEPREHLTVIRVEPKRAGHGCVIAVINARRTDANARARAAADSSLKCN